MKSHPRRTPQIYYKGNIDLCTRRRTRQDKGADADTISPARFVNGLKGDEQRRFTGATTLYLEGGGDKVERISNSQPGYRSDDRQTRRREGDGLMKLIKISPSRDDHANETLFNLSCRL